MLGVPSILSLPVVIANLVPHASDTGQPTKRYDERAARNTRSTGSRPISSLE